jgi:LDH2 family malate/lactate/ureidoglycolate dehydrogenase
VPELSPGHVTEIASELLRRLGSPDDIADAVAEWLVRSDLSGHPSHGVMRVIDYAKRIRSGDLVPDARPNVVQGADGGPTVLVDGCGGYGQAAANKLVQLLIERTKMHRIAIGGTVNASHSGRLGEWAELAARNDTVLFMCSSSLARGNVVAYGAREARLGTNPMAFGMPAAGEDAMVLDYATSEISGGKIDYLIQAGEPAPPGTLFDRNGDATSDPNAFYDGGMLAAFGGHKGYGLTLMISLLGGCLVGQAAPGNPRHGLFALAIDPGSFAERDGVLATVHDLLERMRATPPRDGFERVEVPGDYERRNRSSKDTVEIPAAAWETILRLGESLDLPRERLTHGSPGLA